jgi:hypothetical protein
MMPIFMFLRLNDKLPLAWPFAAPPEVHRRDLVACFEILQPNSHERRPKSLGEWTHSGFLALFDTLILC